MNPHLPQTTIFRHSSTSVGAGWTVRRILSFYMLLSLGTVAQGLAPIEIKGHKFFNSETGQEFVVKGVDYFPRPNDGLLNQNSMDLYTDDNSHIWQRDITYLKDLGVNAVRLYAVNASQNHDAFMCAMEEAGIYVIIALAHECPTCAITGERYPRCYPPQLKVQGQAVMNAFAKYPNTLAFSAGNEVNHFAPLNKEQWNAPCQKKFLRDMREYMESTCNFPRKIPIGLVSADDDRDDLALYYNCHSSKRRIDPFETADWYGLNTYVFCDGNATTFDEAEGLQLLVKSFESYNYSIPTLLTEFGCLSESFDTLDGYEGQRNFNQAKWMLDQASMREQFSGGFAFEYSIEKANAGSESSYPFVKFGHQNYGIGYFSPDDCNDHNITCKYHPMPSFGALKDAYTSNQAVDLTTMVDFQPSKQRQARAKCPRKFPALDSINWRAVNKVSNLVCPSPETLAFQCSRPSSSTPMEEQQVQRPAAYQVVAEEEDWDDKVVHASIFTFVLSLVWVLFVIVLSKLAQITYRQLLDKDEDSVSSEEESAGLLSLKNYQTSDSGGLYSSLDSGSSSNDESDV